MKNFNEQHLCFTQTSITYKSNQIYFNGLLEAPGLSITTKSFTT